VIEENAREKPNHARFTLAEILLATGGASTVEFDRTAQIEGVISDTRADLNGALFVALRGARFDGHTFLRQAQEQGAVAAVVAHDFTGEEPCGFSLIRVEDTTRALGDIARAHRRNFAIPVVGVTGSYGKTTTRALIVAALASAGGISTVLASTANHNNEIGVPHTLLQLEAGHRYAVIEMGMRGPGQIAELARIAEPTMGVITNIGPQHIEFFEGIEGVIGAKAELLQSLGRSSIGIIPANADYSGQLRTQALCRVVTFGSGKADYGVQDVQSESDGIAFQILHSQGVVPVSLPLAGSHNAFNAAAALAVAGELGIDLKKAATALQNVDVPGARMRILRVDGITVLDDSYNAGPDSMRAALHTLQDFTATRHVAVLGAMKELGRWSAEEHRKLGEEARFADALFWVGEETCAAHEIAGGTWFASAEDAAPVVSQSLNTNDCVLVKGSRSVGLEKITEAIMTLSGARGAST
jgi:UDP-N-acetylmuramoyl-tripeptide--D-alanyl-D-alanine ligase